MKKLKELSKEEMKTLYEKNRDFHDICMNDAYDMAMICQGEEAKYMGVDVFDYHDHYQSFYLSTPMVNGAKAPEAVAGKLEADYMTPENAELYKKLCELNDQYEDLEYDDLYGDKGNELSEKMADVCDELADGLTYQLRKYEYITEEQAIEEMEFQRTEGCMADWETDGEKIYQTITKVYE